MKTQAFSLHSLPWLSNFETNQGYKDRQDPSLTLIFPINSNEPKFKDTSIVDTCKGSELVGKDYEPLSRISDAFVTPDQLSRHYKSCFMEGGSIPLVRTSLLSTPTAGLRRRPATPRLPHPPAQMPQKCNVFPKRHLLAVE
ncbi:MAG: hypothetical protein SPL52_12145 [Fibrobacter sp.]|nr:hypothetical protein [Fibrobacter sp.]